MKRNAAQYCQRVQFECVPTLFLVGLEYISMIILCIRGKEMSGAYLSTYYFRLLKAPFGKIISLNEIVYINILRCVLKMLVFKE